MHSQGHDDITARAPKHIIAINTDLGVPILAHADYAVIGGLHQVIPALVSALRAC
jgi:electron transfer flavoprotein alpha subunit